MHTPGWHRQEGKHGQREAGCVSGGGMERGHMSLERPMERREDVEVVASVTL